VDNSTNTYAAVTFKLQALANAGLAFNRAQEVTQPSHSKTYILDDFYGMKLTWFEERCCITNLTCFAGVSLRIDGTLLNLEQHKSTNGSRRQDVQSLGRYRFYASYKRERPAWSKRYIPHNA
jgi:hypothetical protein